MPSRSQQRLKGLVAVNGKLIAAAVLVAVAAISCAHARSGPSLTINPGLKDSRQAARLHKAMQKGVRQAGLASWYGGKFHGRRTANGEVYDMNGLSAAHKTLPFGTVVRVHNLDNGRTLEVRVNDRGPFVKQRILDLSRGAASELGLLSAGVAQVELSLVSWSGNPDRDKFVPPEEPGIWVQAAAFRDLGRAQSLTARLQPEEPSFAVYSDGGWHRVRALVTTSKQAKKLIKKLRRGAIEATIISP